MTPPPLEAYYDLTQISEIAVSPDGSRVAYVATAYNQSEDEPISSLFVTSTDGSREPHQLTTVSGASSPQWSPSGDRLAFLATREESTDRQVGWTRDDDSDDESDTETETEAETDNEATDQPSDDEPETQVWLFDFTFGGDARQVTDRAYGVREFDWSPDGDNLVISARDPTDDEQAYLDERKEGGPIETERLQHKLDGVGYLDTVTSYLFVVDLESGEETRLDETYGGGAMEGLSGLQPAWGPTDRIAFVSCRTDNPDDTYVADLYTIDPDGSNLNKETDSDVTASAPAWSPSGTLAFVAGDPTNWCVPSEVCVSTAEGYRSVTPDLDRTVARNATLEWAGGETLYTLIGDEAKTRPIKIGVHQSDVSTVDRVFDAQGDDRAALQLSIAGGTAAMVLSHPNEGQDVYTLPVEALSGSDEPTRLTDVNRDLRSEFSFPEVRRISWESDGVEISGIVYHDPDVTLDDGPHPLVVAIHGGPISYDEPVFSFDHAALTSRGYVVLRPNYRGGSSFGREFSEALRGQWGTKEVEDITAGVSDVIDRGWVDSDRIFGYGFSYGGIAQGYLITQEPDLFTAAAPEHGIYDLRSAFGTDDTHVWMTNEYGTPWDSPEAFDAASAITDAEAIETPILVTAGGQDWRCPPSQSEQLYIAAKKQGVDAKLVVYPEEHHNIGTPDRAIHRLTELISWYERFDPQT